MRVSGSPASDYPDSHKRAIWEPPHTVRVLSPEGDTLLWRRCGRTPRAAVHSPKGGVAAAAVLDRDDPGARERVLRRVLREVRAVERGLRAPPGAAPPAAETAPASSAGRAVAPATV